MQDISIFGAIKFRLLSCATNCLRIEIRGFVRFSLIPHAKVFYLHILRQMCSFHSLLGHNSDILRMLRRVEIKENMNCIGIPDFVLQCKRCIYISHLDRI